MSLALVRRLTDAREYFARHRSIKLHRAFVIVRIDSCAKSSHFAFSASNQIKQKVVFIAQQITFNSVARENRKFNRFYQ